MRRDKKTAWRYANGKVVFRAQEPKGSLAILPELVGSAHYRTAIEVCCRFAYDHKTLIVPGLPERPGDEKALKRFESHVRHFIRWGESDKPTPGFTLPEPQPSTH